MLNIAHFISSKFFKEMRLRAIQERKTKDMLGVAHLMSSRFLKAIGRRSRKKATAASTASNKHTAPESQASAIAAAEARGRAQERARWVEVFASKAAVANPEMAVRALSTKRPLSAATVIDLLETVPQRPARASLADRMASRPQISVGPAAPQLSREQAVAASWDRVIARLPDTVASKLERPPA
jgi:hypothetical protein